MSDDSLLGLSVFQQLAIIGAVGAAFVLASYSMSSSVTATYNPTIFGIGVVCVGYALVRGGYEVAFGG